MTLVKTIPLPEPTNSDTWIWTVTRSTKDLHIMIDGAEFIHVVYEDDCKNIENWANFWGKEAVKRRSQTIDSISLRYRATEKEEDETPECPEGERRCDDGV